MSLRAKLLLAQLPLALALVAVGVVAMWSVSMLSDLSQLILRDNYQSVLAAERMKESLERLDSAAIFIVAGERSRAEPQAAEHLGKFEQQLKIQEQNITEYDQHEDVATAKLRRQWDTYRKLLTKYLKLSDLKEMKRQYFDVLQPQFVRVKDAADDVLQINQGAMHHRAEVARRTGQWTISVVASVAVGAV
ncbi:MAG TPA: MCP four helix bundle domain-containing protein, partial [Pirellulales bacterium]|nr:MCP four helix bundle domain-containing protein [Pirellulales bacterium]